MAGRIALAAEQAIHQLGAADRADPAGRALAAGLESAEFEGEAHLTRHVDRIVEDDDAAVADEPVARGEGLVVERGVEERARKVRTQWAPYLDRAHGPPAGRAARDFVDELAQAEAERGLEEAAVADVAGELDRHGPAGATEAELGIGGRALRQDEGRGRQRQHVVDNGRAAEEPAVRRQRRPGADLAAPALDALEQRRLLAAD